VTPGPLRPETIQRRLADIRALLDVLHRHADVTGAQLRAELERRLVVERALQQVVDLAAKINAHAVTAQGNPPPADYHTSFSAAGDIGMITADLAGRLAPSAGLRDRLVHEYDTVDHDVVAAAIGEAVQTYGAYVHQVATWLTAARRHPHTGPT
jgi:uncharacterized protein YutE (UPF0331/DUF86 family)